LEQSRDRVEQLGAELAELESGLDYARTYQSEQAFRAALNKRIRQIADSQELDHAEVARRFALQQFMSRLFARDAASWVVTGGTALQFRSPEARSTADLDLTVTGTVADIRDALTVAAARRAGEHGHFTVDVVAAGSPSSYAGRITYILNGSRFSGAKLDVVAGREMPFEPELMTPAPVVEIDDVRPMTPVRTYHVAAHLGDKVAAMYEMHGRAGDSPSTRSHDLADIVILSRCASVDAGELRAAIAGEQLRRGVVVPVPLKMPNPDWVRSYPARVRSSELPAALQDVNVALLEADRFLSPVLDGRVQGGRWDPARRSWVENTA